MVQYSLSFSIMALETAMSAAMVDAGGACPTVRIKNEQTIRTPVATACAFSFSPILPQNLALIY